VARGDARDVDRAVAAAKAAKAVWAATPAAERGRKLAALADLVERNGPRLAELESRDNGKLYAEMLGQVRNVAAWYRYFGGMADKVQGSVIPSETSNKLTYTRHEPLGVVGLITPWNSPLLLLANKLAPALAAGNTAVVKPSEFTSAATAEFIGLFDEAGFPAGAVNLITGLGAEAGAPLVEHPDVAKIAFTGSEMGGQRIYESVARSIKLVSLELGGKSPNIVFDDADLEAAVMGAVTAIFSAAGQSCTAGSRLLLQRGIHDRFVSRLVEVASQARLGDPMAQETNIGPIATAPQFEKILSYIAIAREEGAQCVLGGEAHRDGECARGRFIKPTIFTGVNNRMRIAREEVFGPVLSVIPFEDEAEALSIANDTPYGLAAAVWTSDMTRALRMSERLEAGKVWVNSYRYGSYAMPFGGYKRSGVGREGGVEAIKEYLQVKTVSIDTGSPRANPFVMPGAARPIP
jgi:aldehyde dehydrogenase (NAD+)